MPPPPALRVEPTATTQLRHARYRAAGWWPGQPLVARYERLVAAEPRARAVRESRTDWISRAELWQRAGELATQLAGHGVGAGGVVVVCLPNTIAWQQLFLACLRLRAVPATLPVTSDAATIRYVVGLVGARALVVPETHRGRAFGASVADGAPLVVQVGTELTWQAKAEAGGAPVPEPVEGVAQLMFTSSTTGMPKAVAHTEDTLAAVNLGFAARFGIDADTPIFMASPLGHSVGAWHGARLSLFTGAPLVLMDGWDPQEAIRIVAEEGCAFTAAATPFLKDLVDARHSASAPKLASLRTFLCGGAPVPPALLAAARRELPRTFVTVLWGMTEGGVTTCLPSDPPERVAATAGTGLPGLELCTLAPDGTPQPARTPGELAMRGPGVFVGYHGQDELYREQLTPDGFFRTGDLAEVGTDGYLKITGRLKDLIIRGGVNISPVPIEDALAAHPAIRRVAVIGTPDERMGERLCAVVVPDGAAPSLDSLLAWLAEQGLSRRLWPEELVVVDAMPVTAAGKIRKAALREHVIGGSR